MRRRYFAEDPFIRNTFGWRKPRQKRYQQLDHLHESTEWGCHSVGMPSHDRHSSVGVKLWSCTQLNKLGALFEKIRGAEWLCIETSERRQ